MALALVRHERGDVADDRRVMRQPERLVHVDRRRGEHVLDVDAFVNRDRPLGRHAVGDEHLPDRLGRGDEAVHLPMLPPRERIAFEMKIDAARRDERRRAAAGRLVDAAPIDRASDAIATPCGSCAWMTSGPSRSNDPRQPPRRRQIHLGARRDRDQVETFRGAPAQLAVRVRDERRAVADRAQAVHGQQHLVLAAAPGPRGVDVEGKHIDRPHATKTRSSRRIIKVASCPSWLRGLPALRVEAPRASRTSGTRSSCSAPR